MPHPTAMRALAIACCGAFAGCASSSFAPNPVTPAGMPYEGLDEYSYGPRSTTQFRYCDPQDDDGRGASSPSGSRSKLGETTDAVAASITTALGAPLQGMMKIDAKLQDLDLAGHFRAPAERGLSGMPVVHTFAISAYTCLARP